MRIFLSWSGARSRALALALREWIPRVLDYAAPWVSAADVRAGARWNPDLDREIREADFGLVCLTPENVRSDWILFEVGALAGSLYQGAVCPLLLDVGVGELPVPLLQFQAKNADRDGVLDLLRSINAEAEAQRLAEVRLLELFEVFWPRLEARIQEIATSEGEHAHSRPDAEVLAEIAAEVREIKRELSSREVSAKPSSSSTASGPFRVRWSTDVSEKIGSVTILSSRHWPMYPGPDDAEELAQVSIDHVREYAVMAVAGTSLRKVAKQAGIKVGATKKFIEGSIPYERNARLWKRWYLRQLRGAVASAS